MKVITGAFLWNETVRFTLRFIEQRTEQFKVNGVGCGTVTDMPYSIWKWPWPVELLSRYVPEVWKNKKAWRQPISLPVFEYLQSYLYTMWWGQKNSWGVTIGSLRTKYTNQVLPPVTIRCFIVSCFKFVFFIFVFHCYLMYPLKRDVKCNSFRDTNSPPPNLPTSASITASEARVSQSRFLYWRELPSIDKVKNPQHNIPL
jgi:hypothetical protein